MKVLAQLTLTASLVVAPAAFGVASVAANDYTSDTDQANPRAQRREERRQRREERRERRRERREKRRAANVPELDPMAASAAALVVLGGAVILFDRRRRRT